MKVEAHLPINASKEEIWNRITDIENLSKNIQGITAVEVQEKPETGFVGTKWTETRVMFGKEATETMWITDAKENEYYKTSAESNGNKYDSITSIREGKNGCELHMEFISTPQTFGAKIIGNTIGLLFKGVAKKAFLKDFQDIKNALEK